MAPMTLDRPWDLRITRRCLREDFHLDADVSGRAEDHLEVHPLVRAFVERRGQIPIGQETFRCGTEVTGLPLYTLHAGTDRGATWHQSSVPPGLRSEYELGIVWLLGARAEHDYDGLCALGDDLLPTVDDARRFIDDQAYTFARVLVEEVPQLVARAGRKRGQIIAAVIGGGIRVRLLRDRDDEAPLLTVAINSRPLPGIVALVPEWQARLVLAFFPTEDFASLSVTNEIGGQPLEDGESAYCSFAR